MVNEYLVVKKNRIMGSLWAVILYKTVNVYYLFFNEGFFGDPPSLIDAAQVDAHANDVLKI